MGEVNIYRPAAKLRLFLDSRKLFIHVALIRAASDSPLIIMHSHIGTTLPRVHGRPLHAPTLPCIPWNIIDYNLKAGSVSNGLIAEVMEECFLVHRLNVAFLKIYIVLSNGERSKYNPRFTLRGPDPLNADYACAVRAEIVYQFEYVTITRLPRASGTTIDRN